MKKTPLYALLAGGLCLFGILAVVFVIWDTPAIASGQTHQPVQAITGTEGEDSTEPSSGWNSTESSSGWDSTELPATTTHPTQETTSARIPTTVPKTTSQEETTETTVSDGYIEVTVRVPASKLESKTTASIDAVIVKDSDGVWGQKGDATVAMKLLDEPLLLGALILFTAAVLLFVWTIVGGLLRSKRS